MQFKGLGAPQQAFCNANGVCIDRHIACRCRRCIYVCPACGRYEASQCAFQIWKLFCDQDRQLSSSTWKLAVIFLHKNFRICNRRKQSKPVPPRNFWIRFFQIQIQKHLLGFAQTRYSAQNCAGYTFPLIPNKQIFLDKNLFYENRRWFIQYCIKLELSLPVLKVKSETNRS